jgi:phosphoenolpyruvate carboxylase
MDASARDAIVGRLADELSMLVRTDPLHAHRPHVSEELDRALYVSRPLWGAIPKLVQAIEKASGEPATPVRFGCWIGGDRDGHPDVTVGTTRETWARLQERCTELHLREIDRLMDRLTAVCRNPEAQALLQAIIDRGKGKRLAARLSRRHPREHYRQALETIRVRLLAASDPDTGADAYGDAASLLADVRAIEAALRLEGYSASIVAEVSAWRARVQVFGLHLMRLDLRENSQGYRRLVRSLLAILGHDPERETNNDFEGLWSEPAPFPGWDMLRQHLDERSYDLLAVTDLAYAELAIDPDRVGPSVISMTHSANDVLWVLWIHRLIQQWRETPRVAMSIAPLFETVDDLHAADGVLNELFEHPQYRKHLATGDGRQMVMIGYSDSAKDGGYLAACWALYQGQEEMQAMAAQHGVRLTCFHGRGGALGRGGGPAARAIQALPLDHGHARIRMTEQGEVIADRFVDPELAHRHMEQILGGLLVHAAQSNQPNADWREVLDHMAEESRKAYLELFQHPGFVTYFREATPISSIETLQIGSRPSRRHGQASLQDLRAIPYTFSWTQSRQLINAYFGLGRAWSNCTDKQRELARDMYQNWAFFRSTIDNAELAMCKCHAHLAKAYAGLVDDEAVRDEIGDAVVAEMNATKAAILDVTGKASLLADVPWLQQSVDRRSPYIDVLNHVQIELLRRRRSGDNDDPLANRCLRLSIQAIAAGLRTTG